VPRLPPSLLLLSLFSCSSMLFTSNFNFRYCWSSCVRL
jgi:hypothetical protein